jgi:hypothetical protein
MLSHKTILLFSVGLLALFLTVALFITFQCRVENSVEMFRPSLNGARIIFGINNEFLDYGPQE